MQSGADVKSAFFDALYGKPFLNFPHNESTCGQQMWLLDSLGVPTSPSISEGRIPLMAAKILKCSSTVSTSKMMLNWGHIPTSCFISAPSAISATGEP